MPTTVLAVVIASTFMHAAWNLLVRGHADKQTMVLRMLLVISGAGLVPAVVSECLARSLTPRVWALAAGAGVANGLYYVFLAKSLATADFATAFPVIRALPLVLIALADVVMGNAITPLGWAAILMVAAGCLLTPLERLRDISPRHYWQAATVWILLAVLAGVGYTIPDKLAADLIGADQAVAGAATAARYQYFHLLVSTATVALVGLKFRAAAANANPKPVGWRAPAVAAALNFGAYCMILWAFQVVRQTGYVVAMRQFSIVIGVILAFAIFKERGWRVRLTGAVLITAGIIIIKVGG
jgi:drug/metabolite transporter (DMT)-like permease